MKILTLTLLAANFLTIPALAADSGACAKEEMALERADLAFTEKFEAARKAGKLADGLTETQELDRKVRLAIRALADCRQKDSPARAAASDFTL